MKNHKQDETEELKDKELEQASGGSDVWVKGNFAYLGTFSR